MGSLQGEGRGGEGRRGEERGGEGRGGRMGILRTSLLFVVPNSNEVTWGGESLKVLLFLLLLLGVLSVDHGSSSCLLHTVSAPLCLAQQAVEEMCNRLRHLLVRSWEERCRL